MNEETLKTNLLTHIASDFIVHDEVTGRFLVDNTKVIIDYMLYPRPNLIERGFAPTWFGIEVKSPDGEGGKKGLRVSWQAITYSQSVFSDARVGRNVRPAFVLIYPPLFVFFGSELSVYYLKCLLQKANVGYMQIDAERNRWKIGFGANSYFSSERGLSNTPNVALNRHVGSWK
jgi:hypothetical protein